MEVWAKEAGLDWTAAKVPAYADITSLGLPKELFKGNNSNRLMSVDGRVFLARSDNGHVLGYASDGYQPVQPIDILKWFERYISVDDRFQLDTAGSLKSGEIIWALAGFREPMQINGDAHKAYLLMTTTFDGSGATINKGTVTRVVCNNTLSMSLAVKGAEVRTRHSTKFDPVRVGNELANVVASFDQFKIMGEAMRKVEMTGAEMSNFFKKVLDIPFDVPEAKANTRTLNRFEALRDAYAATLSEGTEPGTSWTALQAVTRYVDHDKKVRANGGPEGEARVLSVNFGSGADLKRRALELLVPSNVVQLRAA